jgi:hypothetical protein
MKYLIPFLLIIIAETATARDCSWYEQQADYYTDLRRKGGNSHEMNWWLKKRNEYRQMYHDCRLGGGTTGQIEKARGNGNTNNYADYRDQVHSNTNDETLQKLIKTCNYWISTHNNHPSFDNRNYRDIACKAVNNREREIRYPTTPETPIVRSVKECMKPGNVIDDEVKDCAQGKINPYWLSDTNSEVCKFWIKEYEKEDTAFNKNRMKLACQ